MITRIDHLHKTLNHMHTKCLLILISFLLLASCNTKTEYMPVEGKWIKGNEKDQLKTIETQFRGLDMTMVEIGYRYQELYWGGHDKHWEYANYQLKKIDKALKIGLQRRPNRAESAESFLNVIIPSVKEAIDKKDQALFYERFNTMRVNCTGCHSANAEESYPTFKVQIPKDRQSPIGK